MKTAPSNDLTEDIREHYDRVSKLYHRFWGEHIHHGYWQNGETVSQAQRRLIEKMVEVARVRRGSRVLDVGCGLGGSSIWLAKNLGCFVEGITISPVQAAIALRRAKKMGVDDLVRFSVGDANNLKPASNAFDVVWVIECSEHLNDKRRFIQQSHDLLKDNGVLAVCAWIDKGNASTANRKIIDDICDGMVCPSLGRLEGYREWMRDAGFSSVVAHDLSDRVARTWDLCAGIAERNDVKMLIRAMDEKTRRFVETFGVMQKAYRSEVLGYGMLAAFRADK